MGYNENEEYNPNSSNHYGENPSDGGDAYGTGTSSSRYFNSYRPENNQNNADPYSQTGRTESNYTAYQTGAEGQDASSRGNTDGSYSYDAGHAQDAAFTQDHPGPEAKKEHPKRNTFFRVAAVALVFGLVAGTTFTGTTYFFRGVLGDQTSTAAETKRTGAELDIAPAREKTDSDQEDTAAAVTSGTTNIAAIAKQVMPSIVSITNMGVTEYQNFFGQSQQYESESAGSGIIISQDDDNLYIATNNHVVTGAKTLTVTFNDDSTVSAEVKGTDPSSDLAVISVALSSIEQDTKDSIRTAVFAGSADVQVGETAIAIGNALGYGQSVTTGVISAVNREVSIQDETTGNAVTNQLIQTDAAINPGNSGGALLNTSGEVIGINSVKYANTSVEGMGYAIPVATAIPIIQELITREAVSTADTGYLGISGVDVTDQVASTYNMPKGVYIAKIVTGSAAEQAGLKQGDIITRFAGRNITSMSEMQDILQYYSAGTEVELTVQRAANGKYEETIVKVTLGKK